MGTDKYGNLSADATTDDVVARVSEALRKASREIPGQGKHIVVLADPCAELNFVDGADALTEVQGVTLHDLRALCSTVTRLQRERDEALLLRRAVNESGGECVDGCDSLTHAEGCGLTDWAAQLARMQKEIEALRASREAGREVTELFRQYGEHEEGCASWEPNDGPAKPCSCGFDNAWYTVFPKDRPAALSPDAKEDQHG